MAAGTISDFTEVVKLQSKDGKKHLFVHKDIISKSSLYIKRGLASYGESCTAGENFRIVVIETDELQVYSPYVSWCYTGSIRDDIALGSTAHQSGASFEYLCALRLLDAQYANAIVDSMTEQSLDAETLMKFCRDPALCELKGSKLWQWYVDQLAGKITSTDLMRKFGEAKHEEKQAGLPEAILQELVVKLAKRVEEPDVHGMTDGANPEKYYMREESIERVWEAWINDEDISDL